MTIEEKEQEIIDEFSIYDDWMDKYAYLIELGSGLEGMDEAHKTEENLIKGCQSRVWFHADMQDGLLYFTADSDAIITKVIAGLLIRVFCTCEQAVRFGPSYPFLVQHSIQNAALRVVKVNDL